MKVLLLEDNNDRVAQFKKRFAEINQQIVNEEPLKLVHVETAQKCIAELNNPANKFCLIFLDHDLDGKMYVESTDINTGAEVGRWINKNPDVIKNSTVLIHSSNQAGAKNIMALIPNCKYVPLVWSKEIFHNVIKFHGGLVTMKITTLQKLKYMPVFR